MSRARAYQRYLKVLRLSQSPEPHEAAAALRHARALESHYGFNACRQDLTFLPFRYRNPPPYLLDLVGVLCDLLLCEYEIVSGQIGLSPARDRVAADQLLCDLILSLRHHKREYMSARAARVPTRRKDRMAFIRRLRRDYERGWAMGSILAIQKMPGYQMPEEPDDISDVDPDSIATTPITLPDLDPDPLNGYSAYLGSDERIRESYSAGLMLALTDSLLILESHLTRARALSTSEKLASR